MSHRSLYEAVDRFVASNFEILRIALGAPGRNGVLKERRGVNPPLQIEGTIYRAPAQAKRGRSGAAPLQRQRNTWGRWRSSEKRRPQKAAPCILERARGGESLWRRGRAPLRRPSLVGQPGCRTAPRTSFPKTEENHRPMSLHLQGQSGT